MHVDRKQAPEGKSEFYFERRPDVYDIRKGKNRW
jgi:hypothetical protein